MTGKRIELWSVASGGSEYDPPEVRPHCLVGYVDGGRHRTITSRIVKTEGRLVTTNSGSVYELGDVNPLYRAWIARNGFAWNDNEPIRILSDGQVAR